MTKENAPKPHEMKEEYGESLTAKHVRDTNLNSFEVAFCKQTAIDWMSLLRPWC